MSTYHAEKLARGMARLLRIRREFAAGESIEAIAERTGLQRKTVEAVIRQAMKLADRKGRR